MRFWKATETPAVTTEGRNSGTDALDNAKDGNLGLDCHTGRVNSWNELWYTKSDARDRQ